MPKELSLRKLKLSGDAWEDLRFWESTSLKTVERINALVDSIMKSPSTGIGKLEKLKHELSGTWSRRINQRDRMVYEVENETLIILQLRGHY
jgi:toxin YoeB